MQNIKINNRIIGEKSPTYIIAEIGVNHNGILENAKKMIKEAKTANADAVKFQTYVTEELTTFSAPTANYQKNNTGVDNQRDLIKKFELSPEDFRELSDYAKEIGITFLSTPFDSSSLKLLVDLGVPAIKVSSGDLTNYPLLEEIKKTNLPIILSTGMATMDEIVESVDLIKLNPLIVLHCISQYPTPPELVNLNIIRTLKKELQVLVGFSDHTLGNEISIAAVTMGACVIEKHFTLDQNMKGPDHKSSLNPMQFSELVKAIRKVESAYGSYEKVVSPEEIETANKVRRSIVAKVDIEKGTKITKNLVAFKRPGNGIPTKHLESIIGKKTKVAIKMDEQITLEKIN
ncbi:MAG: N-acetylneuraminate synthase [Candidatus Ranarchaeia archaeon]